MTSEEIGAVFFLAGYGSLLLLAIKAFGPRRVLWSLGLVAFAAVVVAFRTLGVLTGSRRW